MTSLVQVTDHAFKKGSLTNVVFGNPVLEWTFQSGGMILQNDGLVALEYSFNGRDVAGDVTPIDKWISLDILRQTKIWLRIAAGSPPSSTTLYRVRIWRGEG